MTSVWTTVLSSVCYILIVDHFFDQPEWNMPCVLHASNIVVAEQEPQEQPDKTESQPAAMPDYAAGLLPPTFDVSISFWLF